MLLGRAKPTLKIRSGLMPQPCKCAFNLKVVLNADFHMPSAYVGVSLSPFTRTRGRAPSGRLAADIKWKNKDGVKGCFLQSASQRPLMAYSIE